MRLLLILSLIFSGWTGEIRLATPHALDAYLKVIEANQKAMGSVAIYKGSDLFYANTFGFASSQDKDTLLANTQTLYRIGSISKTIAATIFLQLVEEGKVELSTPLSYFYPQFLNADRISMEMLLTHRSGLHNFTDDPDFLALMFSNKSKEEMLNHMSSKGSDFDPGTDFSYSNTNYVLIGYIIEELEKMPFGDVLQERISDPLQLKYMRFANSINPFANEAKSYYYQSEKWFAAPETNMSIPHAAGGISSTATELGKVMYALFHEGLISHESLVNMLPADSTYGYGIQWYPYRESHAFGHSGGIDGFHSQVLYFPKEDVTVVLLLNALNYAKNDLLLGLLDMLFEHNLALPSFENATLTNEQISRCTGKFYSEELKMNIKLWRKGNTLYARADGQQSFPLTPISERTFRFDAAGLRMEFDQLENSKFNSFVLHQGASFNFIRKE